MSYIQTDATCNYGMLAPLNKVMFYSILHVVIMINIIISSLYGSYFKSCFRLSSNVETNSFRFHLQELIRHFLIQYQCP